MDSIVQNLRDFYHFFAIRAGIQPLLFPEFSVVYETSRPWPSFILYTGSSAGNEDHLVSKWIQEIKAGIFPPFVVTDDQRISTLLNQSLINSGFSPVVLWTGMKQEIIGEQVPNKEINHLHIEPVVTSEQAAQFSEMINGEIFRRNNLVPSMVGIKENDSWYAVIGYVDSQPVATAAVFFSGGSAGIYFVSTKAAYRNRGIGSIMTNHVVETAAKRGFSSLVLHATEAGKKIYAPMGFREYGRIMIFRFIG